MNTTFVRFRTAKVLIVLCLVMSVIAPSLTGRRNTIRRQTKRGLAETTIISDTLQRDTVSGDIASQTFRVTCYDKPLRARHECMLIENLDSVRTIESVNIAIRYMEMDSTIIHERSADFTVKVPPLQRRMVKLSSWDVNHSYYYHLNPTFTHRKTIPYRISVSRNRAIMVRTNN